MNADSVIDAVVHRLTEGYVFEDQASLMTEHLRTRLKAGAYNGLESEALAKMVTSDLRSISHDLHLSLLWREDLGEHLPDTPIDVLMAEARASNFGVRTATVLEGNIGYLDLRQFYPASVAWASLSAAFGLIAHAQALVIDLRQNGGGDPEAVALSCSFLFDQRTHLTDLWHRKGRRTEQFWTYPVPDPRFGGTKPVWILTSSDTFSGGEEFAYDLQARGRATIVGEVTGGGAHPCELERLAGNFGLVLPFARAVNPITGTNWEGSGVQPNVPVPAAQALEEALKRARAEIGVVEEAK